MRASEVSGCSRQVDFLDSVRVAASPRSRDQGVLVVFGSRIYSARDATKVDTRLPDALSSRDFGPWGRSMAAVIFRCVPPSPIINHRNWLLRSAGARASAVDGGLVDAARASINCVITTLDEGTQTLRSSRPSSVGSRRVNPWSVRRGRSAATWGRPTGFAAENVVGVRRDLRGQPRPQRADQSHAGVGCEPDGTGLARDVGVVAAMGGGNAVEHGATEEGVTLRPPASVVDIAKQLEAAGHETWCVGARSRCLAGHPRGDWDLATAARPEEVMRLFPIGATSRGRGARHGQRVLDDQRVLHEVTTFRRDVRTGWPACGSRIRRLSRRSLARRDFTMRRDYILTNQHVMAINFPMAARTWLRRVVRAVCEHRLTGCERIGFAHSARCDSPTALKITINTSTWAAILASAPFLRLSAEPVKENWPNTVVQVQPGRAVLLWRDSAALTSSCRRLAD